MGIYHQYLLNWFQKKRHKSYEITLTLFYFFNQKRNWLIRKWKQSPTYSIIPLNPLNSICPTSTKILTLWDYLIIKTKYIFLTQIWFGEYNKWLLKVKNSCFVCRECLLINWIVHIKLSSTYLCIPEIFKTTVQNRF